MDQQGSLKICRTCSPFSVRLLKVITPLPELLIITSNHYLELSNSDGILKSFGHAQNSKETGLKIVVC